ncbi:hypothetical protein GCM10027399_04540 [Curvibacter fontanus]
MHHIHRQLWNVRCACAIVLALWALLSSLPSQAQTSPPSAPDAGKHALILLQTGYGNRGVDAYVSSFVEKWRQLGVGNDALHVEYLDLARTPDAEYRRRLKSMLLHKYAARKLDLIVALQQPALEYFLGELNTLSPEAPVIAGIASITPQAASASRRRFLQQRINVDFIGTLELARRLLPDTRRVVVLSGAGAADLAVLREFKAIAGRWDRQLSFEYTDTLTADEIRQRLSRLQPGAVVLQTLFNQDATGKSFDSPGMRLEFSRIAKVPTFSLYAINVGIGDDIGGMVWSNSAEGESAAETGVAIMRGQLQLTQAITPLPSRSVPMFNWLQLRRWGADTSELPADSIILNKTPNLWEEHRTAVLGTVLALLLLSGLAVALAIQNRQRHRAEKIARENEIKAQEGETSIKLLVDHAPEAITVFDLDSGLCIEANPNAVRLLARQREEIFQCGLRQLLADVPQPGGLARDDFLQHHLEQAASGAHVATEGLVRTGRGHDVLCEIHLQRMPSSKHRHLRVSFIDITERRENEERIHRLAFYDPLTDLPNRRLLMDRMQVALNTAQRSGEICALLFVDLDHFKNVNDAQGHTMGDLLLQQVARRLRGLLRSEDTVARIGGDEFVILLAPLDEALGNCSRTALNVAEKIRTALLAPYELDEQLGGTSASIGVTLLSAHTRSVDDLLREADTAMYKAKGMGRNSIAFYEPEMHAEIQERLALEADLKLAITRQQLSMHLQTQVDAQGRICGAESLLRWQHPVRGFVPPQQFIELAESSGLIIEIGNWVLAQCCGHLAQMARRGSTLSLAVNISPRQFNDPGFVDRVREILESSGAPAHQLVLEVTEGLLIHEMEQVLERMNALAALGVRFSIDDFGTGYSNLAYLNRMPLYELKIDKSFVQGLPDDANARGIVQSILSMARHFTLHVVAEGVETEAQADFLKRNDCAGLQGYFYARPIPAQEWLDRL